MSKVRKAIHQELRDKYYTRQTVQQVVVDFNTSVSKAMIQLEKETTEYEEMLTKLDK